MCAHLDLVLMLKLQCIWGILCARPSKESAPPAEGRKPYVKHLSSLRSHLQGIQICKCPKRKWDSLCDNQTRP